MAAAVLCVISTLFCLVLYELAPSKSTLHNAFITHSTSSPLNELELQSIKNAMQKDDFLRSLSLIQAIAYNKDSGGSGGLKRYRLLVDARGGRRSILEFKQSGIPGTNFGKPSTVLSFEERLPILKKRFWDSTSTQDYFYIEINGIRFLVRDRLAIHSINLAELNPADLKSVLLAQVSYLAKIHADGWQKVEAVDLQSWLEVTYPTLAARWAALYDASASN